MKPISFTLLTLGCLMTGCSSFTFEPENRAPQTELDQVVQSQQEALQQQQQAALNE